MGNVEENVERELMTSGEILIKKCKSMVTDSVSLWDQTLIVCQDVIEMYGNVSHTTDQKEYVKAYTNQVYRYLDESSASKEVPKYGLNRSGKKVIELRKKSGRVKWSSWDATARLSQYLSDIAKASYHSIPLKDSEGDFISRSTLLNKVDATAPPKAPPMSPRDKCIEGATLIYFSYDKMSDEAEKKEVREAIEKLYIKVMEDVK